MRSFRELLAFFVCASLVAGSVAMAKDDKGKDADKKKQSGKKKDVPEAVATPPPDGKGKLSLPLVEGHDSKGLKIPYYDTAGKLQMVFTIGIATRLDPDHVRMTEAQVETFNEEGEQDMKVDLPTSMLDLNTRVVTSNTKTTIKREDFVITGDSVKFDTMTKEATLVGNVHMIIYDLNAEAAPKSEEKPHEK